MPITYRIEPDLDLIYFLGTGTVTGDEYVEANLTASRDPARRPDQKGILDLRAVTELDISHDDMQRIVEMDRELVAHGRYGASARSAVVARGLIDEMLAQLYMALTKKETVELKPFRSLDEAIDWLDLSAVRARVHQIGEALSAEARSRA